MGTIKIKNITNKYFQPFEIIGIITKKQKTSRGIFVEHALTTLTDDSGSILLNLWRDQVRQVDVGDTIHLKAAFVERKRGLIQLSTREKNIEVLKYSKSKKIKQSK